MIIQPVKYDVFSEAGLQVDMLRDDLLFPGMPGNKWRKLQPLKQDFPNGIAGLATFGGAFSNHLAAVAWFAKEQNLRSKGFVRGEDDPSNPTLTWCRGLGMEFEFLRRSTYRIEKTRSGFDTASGYYFIPEGGATEAGIQGTSAITNTSPDYDFYCVSAGTGTTATGMIRGLDKKGEVLVFPALRNPELHSTIQQQLPGELQHRFQVRSNAAGKGFGRADQDLVDFAVDFYDKTGIPSDLVYNAKMLMALRDDVKAGFFRKGARLLIVNTGGLQGNQGMKYLHGFQLPAAFTPSP